MDIPVKYVMSGPRQECEALRGQARRVMFILDTMMRLSGAEQQVIKFIPYDGALIVAQKYFGTRVLHIYTGAVVQKEKENPEKECICTCNFSTGYIFDVPQNDRIGDAQIYSVMACVGQQRYRLFSDILASDFTLYEVAQKVILIPYNEMEYLCCATDRKGSSTGCAPSPSTLSRSDEDWRTTYRIIPWCGFKIPKWIRRQ